MLVEEFLLYLNTQSTETLRTYRDDVGRYLKFLQIIGCTLETATAPTVEQYIAHLNATSRNGRALAPASIARRLTVVSSYLDFLYVRTRGAITNHARDVRRPKVRNVRHRALDVGTQEILLNGIDNARDKALIALYLASGLRLEEARQLDVTSIARHRKSMPDGSRRTLGMGEVKAKGGKIRSFLVDEQTLTLLVAYLKIRGIQKNTALFLSNRKIRLSRRSIQDILSRWCNRLGLPHARIHSLRHSFCQNAVDNGVSSLVLQELMAHKSLTVTQRYFAIRPERLAAEYFAVQERLHQRLSE